MANVIKIGKFADFKTKTVKGWSCPQCTLVNKPTRPGCEMCGAVRPEDYVIPIDYVATTEEVARLADEGHRDLQVRKGWSCPQCTFLNKPSRPGCAMCGADRPEGWSCPQCTLLNKPTRPGCAICGANRPEDYVIPNYYVATPEEVARLADERHRDLQVRKSERKRVEDHQLTRVINYQKILETDQHDLIPNMDKFTCPICTDDFKPGDGVMLRECLHVFCRGCLAGSIQHTEDAGITCPYQDESYSCAQVMQEREIKALVPKELYEKFLQRGLTLAENQADNSYHCKTTNCKGWCIYEDDVNFFRCEVCTKPNCLTCKVIHEGMNCRQYQDMLRDEARKRMDGEARQTQQALERMLQTGAAKRCPNRYCTVVIQKNGGCDHMRCSQCNTRFNWSNLTLR